MKIPNHFFQLLKSFIFIPFIFMSFQCQSQSFKNQQQKYPRVRTAYSEKESAMTKLLTEKGLQLSQLNILLIGYKSEEELQIWAKNKQDTAYRLLITYNFCSSSGVLGPKRKSGDLQIPEGFYHISYFNPYSNFYLSLKVSYPNQSDRILGVRSNLGGDIFIHGACCTIGCIPITDNKIKELYVLAVEARNNGQTKIPTYIFPAKLTDKNMQNLRNEYIAKPDLISFWENLQTGYKIFQKTKKPVKFSVDGKGKYIF